MRHGEGLQARALARVRAAFGPRAAILSPAKATRATPDDAFVAHGAGMIYVHSKVMIADEKAAMVGSANMNGRSLRWDTEVSALWRDPASASAFLARLGESWLGPARGPANRLATWRAAAEENAAKAPDMRDGFLLPHDAARARRFGKLAFFLPDDLF